MNQKTIALYTLGCKLNFSETSTIGRLFNDFRQVDYTSKPDVFLLNTCSVTENTDKKCLQIIQKVLRNSPQTYVIIIGCYAQLKPKEIAQIPGVDVVLGTKEKFQVRLLIQDFTKRAQAQIYVSKIREAQKFNSSYSLQNKTRTFLKVQDGCNYHCTYCTIPLARGKSRSDSINNILHKVKEISQKDVKEIVLTGVNIGDYGKVEGTHKYSFLELIQTLDKVEDIARFRISSIEPNLLTKDIIHFVKKSKRFTPHFHIPLQSGSDRILQAMNRKYNSQLYQEKIYEISQVIPYCGIGVDVIVGFPGETEGEFLETYTLLNQLPITYLHVFPYSERKNTASIKFAGSIPTKVREKRARMLRILSEKKKRKFYLDNLGRIQNVLFEKKIPEKNTIEGFTENYIRVVDAYQPERENSLHRVLLQNINEEGLVTIA